MLAEKAKQQEELLTEYEDQRGQHELLEREMEAARADSETVRHELQVGAAVHQ